MRVAHNHYGGVKTAERGEPMSDTTTEEYLLFPHLPEGGEEIVQEMMDGFKAKMVKVCEETLGDLYTDISCHAEGDHWTNYRNKLIDGFRNYGTRLVQGEHDFKKIREEIYKEFRTEIIDDLNQDHLKKIEELENHIDWLDKMRRQL
jgi:hypothetical protein